MKIEEAITHFLIKRAKYIKRLENCVAKQNRLPEEKENLKRKIEYTELAIEALNRFDGVNEIIEDIEKTTWYRKNGYSGMVEGAKNRDEAWYKASDILDICDKNRINEWEECYD